MPRTIQVAATSQTIYLYILSGATSPVGQGLTALAYNTAGLTAYYVINGSASVAITLATLASASAAWATGGFKEVDATNAPGLYRLDLPNAALASGASVVVYMQGAANMLQVAEEIQLVAYNPQDAVHLGLTALPNATASAAGGLLTFGSSTGQINPSGGVVPANATAINGVATTSVTTINAVIGSAVALQIDGSGYVKVSSGTGTGQINLASGRPGINWADVTNPTTTLDLSGTTIKGLDLTASVNVSSINSVSTSSVTTVAAVLGTGVAPQQDVSGYAKVSSGTGTGQINLASGRPGINWGDVTNQTSAVGLTGTTISTAQVIAQVSSLVIRTGTAQAGAAATITLDSGASATNNLYQNEIIYIQSGTGAGQINSIASYVGSTKVATVANNWITNPASDSVFYILSTGIVSAASSPTTIANAVWNTTVPAAFPSGSAGYALGNGSSPSSIASAVWSTDVSSGFPIPDAGGVLWGLQSLILNNGGRVYSLQQNGPQIGFVISQSSAYNTTLNDGLTVVGVTGAWLDITGATLTFEAIGPLGVTAIGAGTIVTAGAGAQVVALNRTNAQSAAMALGTLTGVRLLATGGNYSTATVILASGTIQVVP